MPHLPKAVNHNESKHSVGNSQSSIDQHNKVRLGQSRDEVYNFLADIQPEES